MWPENLKEIISLREFTGRSEDNIKMILIKLD
jgi:hypothetical protein